MMVSNEEKRWIVVGIAMFQVAAPVLRNVVKQGMDTHYTNLDAHCSGLPTSCTLNTLTYRQVNADLSLKNLKFQNVNSNLHIHGKSKHLYNYCINCSVDLAKLYLSDYLTQFANFDESLDMTAVLRLLGFASYAPAAVFSPLTQVSADDVRENVRNKWGHFDVSQWTEAFFKDCFAKLEMLVKSLGLAAGVETTTLNQLNDWQTKGCQLCIGHAVDQNLLSLVQQDVNELIKKYEKTENSLHCQEQQMKESKKVLEKLVSVEKTLREELVIRVQGVEEGLAQTDEKVQGIKENLAHTDERVQGVEEGLVQTDERVQGVEEGLTQTDGRVQGVKEGLAQTDKRVKQLEEDFRGQRLKGDGPVVLSTSSQQTTVPLCSSDQASSPGPTAVKQSRWSKIKGLFKRSSQDAFLKWSRNQLRSCYNSTMSQVMISPWNPDNTLDIDEVYVELSFLRNETKADGTTKEKLEDYGEIFRSHGEHLIPKRIVVYGEPGIGKSTFTKKLAVDWSRGKKRILKKFAVLLLVKLRDICDAQDLRSMLEKAELLSADDPTVFESLYNFIIKNQQKVLLVLDGYDEYSGENASPVHQIWRGSLLRDGFVVITSRPTKEQLITSSHAQFEISGFSAEQVKRFALKVFKNPEDVRQFTGFLSERRLWDMARIPLLLLMLCLTWQEKGREALSASHAKLYESFLETLFNHMAAKHPDQTFASLDECKEDLAKLGKLAFDALLEDCLDLKLDKVPQDIHALIQKLINVGFFQISKLSRSARPEQVLVFLHKSIHEFLSAWFIVRELKNAEKGDLTCLSRIDSFKKIQKMVEVLKFVCEMSSEAAGAVFGHLQSAGEKEGLTECSFSGTPSIEDLSKDQRDFRITSLDCLLSCPASETQDVYLRFLQCINSVVVVDYDHQLPVVAREHLFNVSIVALPDYLFLESYFPEVVNDDVFSIMRDLEALVFTPYGATKVDAGQCTDLKLNHFFLKAEGQQMILYLTRIGKGLLGDLQPVELVRAFSAAIESPPQEPVNRHSSQNQNNSNALCLTEDTSDLVQKHSLSFVREIDIRQPTSEEFTVINNLLAVNWPRVISISCFSDCSAQLIETFVSRIPFTNSLYELKLEKINLTAKSAADIAKSLHQAPNLQNLDLSENNLHGAVSELAVNLHQVSQLTQLRWHGVHMGEEECRSIAAALKHLPCLEGLSLSKNPLGQGIVELAKHFSSVPHLTNLHLDDTQMGEEEVTAVAHALKDVPELESLYLSFNPLGRGVSGLLKRLISIPQLRFLLLWGVKMTKKEASDLLTASQERDFIIRSDYHTLYGGGYRLCTKRELKKGGIKFDEE